MQWMGNTGEQKGATEASQVIAQITSPMIGGKMRRINYCSVTAGRREIGGGRVNAKRRGGAKFNKIRRGSLKTERTRTKKRTSWVQCGRKGLRGGGERLVRAKTS